MTDVGSADTCLLYRYNKHKTRCKVNIMQQGYLHVVIIRSPVAFE